MACLPRQLRTRLHPADHHGTPRPLVCHDGKHGRLSAHTREPEYVPAAARHVCGRTSSFSHRSQRTRSYREPRRNVFAQSPSPMKLRLHDLHLPMRHAFTIAHGTTTVQHNLLVELSQDGVTGYGEGASSHAYKEFTAESMRRALEAAQPAIESEQMEDPGKLWDRIFPVLSHNRFAL